CLGKVIGGGLPVGAYGGKRKIMEHVAPTGNIYQAGTLSGNPLAMTAGLATLGAVSEDDYTLMNQKVDRLVEGYRAAADKNNIDLFKKYYQGMIEEGMFLPPSQFEGLFMSTAHTDEDIEQTIKAIDKVFATL